ncbi:hypothetical protein FRC04_009893 [Tulasnella sp. 424]|nr:hypothetical protein FRC04_009893 [Tulasnella sp. 424]KAG8971010.1 hypothetical protein FRC05_011585 [Tulasnella sp. 425]
MASNSNAQPPNAHLYPPSEVEPQAADSALQNELTKQEQKKWLPAGYGRWNIRIRMMLCLVIPTYLDTLDYTVVATAQPHIASDFNRLELQSWIGTSFLLTSTVFLPIFGSIADILGRHWALQVAVWTFLVGSAVCTGAQSMISLLAGRGIAGIGAAGLVSVIRIILTDSGSLNEDNIMNAVLIVFYTIGFSTGPVVGGALLTKSFRWIFGINLPPGVVSSVLIFFLLRPILRPGQPSERLRHLNMNTRLPSQNTGELDPTETRTQKLLRADWVGTILFIAGGILILLALSMGSSVQKHGYNTPITIASFTIGFTLIIIFVGWEYLVSRYMDAAVDETRGQPRRFPGFLYRCPKWFRLTEPAIPLDIFKSYDVVATSFAALTGGMVLFAGFYFLAIYFAIVQGYSAEDSGVQLLWFAPGLGGGTVIALILIRLFKQPKYPSMIGCVLITVGIGLLATALSKNSPIQLKVYLLITGIGLGLSFGPLMIQARYCQPSNRVATVVSMNNFFRTAGGTIGLAQLSAVLDTQVKNHITHLASSSGDLTPEQIASLGSLDSVQNILSLDPSVRAIVQDAFRLACRWSFISLIPWCAIAAVMCLFLKTIPKEDLNPRSAQTEIAGEQGTEKVHAVGAVGPSSSTLLPESRV